MSIVSGTHWRKRLAVVALAALMSIGALTVPSGPAKARVFVSFGIGAPVGWAYPPPPHPVYYPYPYYYYRYPAVFIGGPFGPYRYWHRWHYWR